MHAACAEPSPLPPPHVVTAPSPRWPAELERLGTAALKAAINILNFLAMSAAGT